MNVEQVKSIDEAMGLAIEHSYQVKGTTYPNPPVGAVIVDPNGRIVGAGGTEPAGGDHAEVVALRRAGGLATGAIVVVTMEPCNHYGKTPPCVNALIEARVGTVVYAVADPNGIAGGGAGRLSAAGLQVRSGVLAEQVAAGPLREWLHKQRTGLPHVTWKYATSIDGRSAAADGSSQWISSEAARLDLHRRRAIADAILVGTGTVLADDPAQLLDVWRRKDMPTKPAPVLIFVPGGAWVHGSRAIQGYAVLSRLAAQGWVCLSIDYRVAPHHRWPRHILDVKTAIAWARANVDKFGGDRNFIAVAGCSAGGHLSALAGLTANDPQYQAELPEGSDTSVDAVVGIYGRYDWEDRSTPERARFVDFLERVVVQRTIDRHPEVFRDASPIQRVTRNAPPFLVIHGSRDCVIPVEQARSFVERLRAVSRSQVGYLELPGAGHGFDLLDGARTGPTAHAIALFLNQVHRSRAQFAKEVI